MALDRLIEPSRLKGSLDHGYKKTGVYNFEGTNFEAGGGGFSFPGHHQPTNFSNSRTVTPVCLSIGSCLSRYAAMARSASLSAS